jgi:hypothetical protein
MNPILVSAGVAVVILCGAFAGRALRQRLPGHHLDADTKDIVKSGIGLLATLAALVLGLIVGAAKASFDAQAADVQSAAVKVALLDRTLGQLGPAGAPLRAELYAAVSSRVGALWGGAAAREGFAAVAPYSGSIDRFQSALAKVPATNESQRQTLEKATALVDELMQIRFLAMGHGGSPITMPLLALLSFWFVVIALGLNVFAPRNATILALDLVCAASVAGAIFLILEMEHPFGGVIRLSDAPLRAALAAMRG